MKPPRHAPAQMTLAHNRAAAMMKATLCPLDKLDEAMIASIARTHASQRTGGYEAMLAYVRGIVDARRGKL